MTGQINMLHFDSIISNLNADTTKQVLQKLSEHISNLVGTSQKTVYETLVEQERQQSSGIGRGVAIAHMRLPRLTRPLTIFAKLEKSIDFQSVDGEPVDLICLVMSPEHEGSQHLNRRASVSRNFNDVDLCNRLRGAEDAGDIKMLIKQFNERKLAA